MQGRPGRLTSCGEYGKSPLQVADARQQEAPDAASAVKRKHVDPRHIRRCTSLAIPLRVARVFASSGRRRSGAHGVTYLLIGLGGFLGANARYLVGTWMAERYGISFPYGTVVINVSGSFLLGFFLIFISERLSVHPNWRLFFAIGFLGAYTTFSTFSFENFALLQERSYLLALANMLGSVALGLMAVVAGIIVARLF
jgi:fluoride exporter